MVTQSRYNVQIAAKNKQLAYIIKKRCFMLIFRIQNAENKFRYFSCVFYKNLYLENIFLVKIKHRPI